MERNFSVVLLSLALLVVTQVFADSDSEQEVEVSSHHTHHQRHRHRHHHSTAFSSDSQEFVAAYRVTEAPPSPPEVNEDSGEGRSINSLEERLESLESDVRHLCIEDEEDVERRIRYLGVQCKCPKTEAPVCGSDNVTYYNRCYLQCRASQVEQSYHRYEKITLKKFGPC